MFPFEEEVIVDFKEDFFKKYPQMLILFEGTPSPNMWAYTLLYHENSPIRNLSTKRKLLEVARISKMEINYDNYKEEEALFQEGCVDPNQRSLNVWREKLDERDEYLKSLSYKNPEDVSIIEKALSASKSIWDGYWQAEKQLKKDSNSRVTGDQEESATEKGLI